MKLKQKITCICLAAVSLLPSVGAMKSSISVPENMHLYDYSEEKEPKDSPYDLGRTCSRVIRESHYVPIDKTIGDTADLCIQTFVKMYNFLCYDDVPGDCFYITGLSNYMEVLQRINYIIFNIILQKSDSIKQDFIPSPKTIEDLCKAERIIQRFKNIYKYRFGAALSQPLGHEETAKQIYMSISVAEEGIDRILSLDSFTEDFT